MQQKWRRRETALVMAMLVIAAALWTIFASPAFGAVSDGSYPQTMAALRLTWAGDPVPEGQVVTQLAYTRFDYATLLSPGQTAMAYPVALVRLMTEPFGLGFDMRYLAVAYACISGLGAALMVDGLLKRNRMLALLSGAAVVLLMLHSTIIGYFNSLYATGAVIAFVILFLGCLIHGMTAPVGSGPHHAVWTAASGVLLLQTQFLSLVFLPAVVIGVVLTMLHGCPRSRAWLYHAAVCLAVMVVGVQSVIANVATEKDVTSLASGYLAVFQGYLAESEQPEADLAELGLDVSYAADIGRSFYADRSEFAHDPNSDEALAKAVSVWSRLGFAMKHPERLTQMIDNRRTSLYDAFNEHLVTDRGDTRYTRLSPYLLLDLLVGEGGFARRMAFMLSACGLSLLLLLITWRRSGLRRLSWSLAAFFLCAALYLPMCVALDGAVNISMHKVIFFFLGWLALFAAAAMAVILGQRLAEYLAERGSLLARREELAPEKLSLGWMSRLKVTRNGLTALCVTLCAVLALWLMLPQNHAAGVNNGDFGRMMEQLDLYWTQELLDNQSDQLAARVVEDYAYREPFHAERLTPADPTYSLLFPSMLVRLWSALSGSTFSTQLLALILLAMTITAVGFIVYDLYPYLGRATVILALGMVVMLMGENYVAWYDSLFGESSISTGLMMTIACAIHLSVMPRGDKRSWLWLVLLALSARFLSCAKAQMALALPFGLLLTAALAVYHHPKGIKRLAPFVVMVVMLCGLMSWDTYRIYTKNAGVSEKQTIWQSVFYGALMVTDDPDAVMAELDIDPAMKADIGKHAYYADEDYVYPVLSEDAERAFYSKVTTGTMVKFYLTHPVELLRMLDHAAMESRELHTGFMAYTNERYSEHEGLYRFNWWRMLRPITACTAFWQYVVLYGAALIWCVKRMLKKDAPGWQRLLPLVFVCVMLIGALQYPLSVVGNGFADNNKQMYCFMLCHDLMLLTAASAAARWIVHFARKEKKTQEGGGQAS